MRSNAKRRHWILSTTNVLHKVESCNFKKTCVKHDISFSNCRKSASAAALLLIQIRTFQALTENTSLWLNSRDAIFTQKDQYAFCCIERVAIWNGPFQQKASLSFWQCFLFVNFTRHYLFEGILAHFTGGTFEPNIRRQVFLVLPQQLFRRIIARLNNFEILTGKKFLDISLPFLSFYFIIILFFFKFVLSGLILHQVWTLRRSHLICDIHPLFLRTDWLWYLQHDTWHWRRLHSESERNSWLGKTARKGPKYLFFAWRSKKRAQTQLSSNVINFYRSLSPLVSREPAATFMLVSPTNTTADCERNRATINWVNPGNGDFLVNQEFVQGDARNKCDPEDYLGRWEGRGEIRFGWPRRLLI